MKRNSNIYINIPHTLYGISLSSDSSYFMNIMRDIYSPYILNDGTADIKIYVDFEHKILLVSSSGNLEQLTLDVDNAVGQTCALFQNRQYSRLPWNLYHGTAIRIREKTVVFLGESGVGKSTAIAYLTETQKDSIYLAEDMLLINCEENRIIPYPRPLHLREGGIRLLWEEYGIVLDDAQRLNFHNYDRYILKKTPIENVCYPVDIYIRLSRLQNVESCSVEEITTDKVKEFASNCYLPRNVRNNVLCSVLLSGRVKLWKASYTKLDNLYQMVCDIADIS